jgi:hypothetical protein
MKNILLIISTAIFCFNLNASDTITLKNRKVIHAYIIEKSDTRIKYRTNSISNLDSTYTLKLTQIKTILYHNGEVDLLSSQNLRSIYPLGINSGFMVGNFMPMFLGSIDYFINPNISTEVSFKWVPFTYNDLYLYSIGGKYWLANKYSKKGFSPYVGVFLTRAKYRNDEDRVLGLHEPEWLVSDFLEVPIGISYITKFGLQTSLQLDNYLLNNSNKLNIVSGIIELRIGWRFKTGK